MWIRSPAELGTSHAQTLNFLWHDPKRRLYVMDNHLAALWCWLRDLGVHEEYTLIHVDAHWDGCIMPPGDTKNLSGLDPTDLDAFTALRSQGGDTTAVMWDNYISGLLALRSHPSEVIMTAHQHLADLHIKHKAIKVESPDSFFRFLNLRLEQSTGMILLNIDLDYLFLDISGSLVRSFSTDFLAALVSGIRTVSAPNLIITVSWSPETCGGWAEAATACKEFCEALGVTCPANESPLRELLEEFK